MPTVFWYPLRLTELILEGERTLSDICSQASKAGVEFVELYDGLLEPLGPTSARAARQMLDDCGVRVAMILCAQDFASPSLSEREEQAAQAEKYLDIARDLGAHAVRLSAGVTHPGITRPDALSLAVEQLEILSGKAKERGLIPCIENVIQDPRWHAADVAAPAASFKDLVERTNDSGIRVLFNTGNAPLVMANTLEMLRAIPPQRLLAVHLSERSTVNGAHETMGDGSLRWNDLRETLQEINFQGPFGLVDGQTEGEAGTSRSMAFVRQWLARWEPPVTTKAEE